ncbi:sulfite exporter TauE/SafE family protein [Niabella insulamsoli]|uniref:sulfite exporter TauE/SafE family protein n=1 Tax=Niabella insulamsoli TaxID=3144874 RepID=UPI0031FC39CE
MEVLGYIAALFIGLSLGLVGGGGSILTVPILVYLFGVSPVLATSYSLFIVGLTSLVGAAGNFRQNNVELKTAFLFGSLSMATVFCVRHFIIPNLPEQVLVAGHKVSVSTMMMLMFASLMILSSVPMIKNETEGLKTGIRKAGVIEILFYGVIVGLVTGLLGAGGGFLLTPALIILLRIPIKRAVGTSLVIITINSFVGFADDVTHHTMNWALLLTITGVAILGIFIGLALSRNLDKRLLKKGFGWFVLIMGMIIVIQEIIKAVAQRQS